MASAIIVAAGKGIRMKQAVRKQYLLLGGLPVVSHTIRAFDACKDIEEIILVVPEEDQDYCRGSVILPIQTDKTIRIVSGGAERQESVRKGLYHVQFHDIAVIHDGVRPFVQPNHISDCIQTAEKYGACISAIPVIDTLKRVNDAGVITETVPRRSLWQAQTPQAFRYDLIRNAHDAAVHEGIIGTDDASILEKLGFPVKIISGSRFNIKITDPEDLIFAEMILMFYNLSLNSVQEVRQPIERNQI